MKRIVIVLLVLMLLPIGCITPQQTAETETPAPTDAPTAVPETPAPTATPEPTEEPEPQPPYVDARKPYTYIMTEERDLKWEEDIVYFANTFLDPYHGHPLLSDRMTPTLSYNDLVVRYGSSGTQNFFDPALKAEFIDRVNALILSIPELSDNEIMIKLIETVAILHDLHSGFGGTIYPFDACLPFFVQPFVSDEGTVCVIDETFSAQKSLLGMQLLNINGVPVEEILDRLRPLVSYENEAAFRSLAMSWSCIANADLLRYIGVIGESDYVSITVRDRNGTVNDYDIPVYKIDDFVLINGFVSYNSGTGTEESDVGRSLMYSNPAKDVWHCLLNDGKALYIRVNTCKVDDTITKAFDAAITAGKEAGSLEKIILDFRSNTGGYPDLSGNFLPLATFLSESGAEVFILIDGGSYPAAIALPSVLRRRVEGAKIVGSLGGQPTAFFVGGQFKLPNSGFIGQCSSVWDDFWPGNTDEALTPDVIVENTLEDFLNGCDSVLKYILQSN